jgi:hypothetical protein
MMFSIMLQTSSNTDMELIKAQMLEKAKRVLFLSMAKMEGLAISYCPVDTGMLRSSIHLSPNYPGSVEYILAAGVYYAAYVEYGTFSHVPPVEALKGWSGRVLGDENLAWAVQRKIGIRGTKSQPYFRPALHEVEVLWFPRYKQSVFGQ